MLKTGQAIAALRTKANMTQEQLAAKLFVSRDLVSKWETGKSPPTYQMLRKLSELFAVEVEALLDKNQILAQELASCIPSRRSSGPKTLFLPDGAQKPTAAASCISPETA